MNRFALPAPWGIGRIFAVALIVAGLPLWSATSRASSAFAGMPPGQVAAAAPADTDACAKETNPDRAIEACNRLLQAKDLADAERAILLYDRGAAYQARRDFDQAIQDYDQAIKLSPDFVQAFYNRGVSHFRRNEDDLAIVDLDHAIALKADNQPAFRARGDAYQSKGDNDRAIRDYDEAIRLKPDDAEAWSDRGTSYLNKSENARAIEDFNQALRLDPSFAVVLTNRGTAYSNTGDDAHAIADFNRAISLNPTLALAYNNRGISYNNRGQFDLAITDFNQAMRLSPGFAEPYYNRGRSLFERGRFATAAPDFAAAVAREPSELYFSIWLYLTQTRAGQKPASVLPDSVTSGNAPDLSVWPGPIISMFSGALAPDKLVFVAANPDPRTQKNQICEAHFYLGEYDVINGASRKSFEEFRAAMATCPHSFDEYVSARAELRRIALATAKPGTGSGRGAGR